MNTNKHFQSYSAMCYQFIMAILGVWIFPLTLSFVAIPRTRAQ